MPTHTIDVHTAQQWLTAGEAILIDVREPAEFASEHIADAHSIPLSRIRCTLLPSTPQKIIVQCQSGRRGTTACAQLDQEQPDVARYHLDGGIQAWKAAGLPVVRGARHILPLDRQVQLTVGIGILTGSVLAATVSPAFLLLTGFFGAGLTFAGATGFCGLARILARAPWNQR